MLSTLKTLGTSELLVIGGGVWILWVSFALLVWVVTPAESWDEVPKPLFPWLQAAKKRIESLSAADLSETAREVATVLEARDRWLAWRYLGVWLPGLLLSSVPLGLMTFASPPSAQGGGAPTLSLDRISAAAGTTLIAILPLVLTGGAYALSVSRLSPTWSSDAEVWRHLRRLLLADRARLWRGPALRRASLLRQLASALQRDFMRMDGVSDPSELRPARRAVVGAVLDYHDRMTDPPNRTINQRRARRFADAWLTGDWDRLEPGTIWDRPVSAQREPRSGGRAVAVVATVIYLALVTAVVATTYSSQETRLSVVLTLFVPLVAPIVITVLDQLRRPRGDVKRPHAGPVSDAPAP